MNRDEGFVSRWARRKAQVRAGLPVDEPPPAATDPVAPPPISVTPMSVAPAPAEAPAAAAPEATAPAPAAESPPVPTMDDVATLARDAADFSRFVAPQVPADVRNAAMKKLFTDPHFNVMDGLDVYIDDYSQPDPLPRSMLRSLVQSRLLGLFDDEPKAAPAPAVPAGPAPATDLAAEPPAELAIEDPTAESIDAAAAAPSPDPVAATPLDDEAAALRTDDPSDPRPA